MEPLQQLHEDFKIHLESDKQNFADIKSDLKEIKEGLKSWTDTYDGVMFTRKFLIGVAGLVLAIASIGGAIMWMLNYIRHGN